MRAKGGKGAEEGGKAARPCRRGDCIGWRDRARDAEKRAQKAEDERDRERLARAQYLKGDMRRVEAELAEAVSACARVRELAAVDKQLRTSAAANAKYLGAQFEGMKLTISEQASLIAKLQSELYRRDRSERSLVKEEKREAAAARCEAADARREATAAAEQLAAAEAREEILMEQVEEARCVANDAMEDYRLAAEDAAAARGERDEEQYAKILVERQLARARAAKLRAEQAKLAKSCHTAGENVDSWVNLSKEATWKRGQRDRAALSRHLAKSEPRVADIAIVLSESGMMEDIFDSPAGTALFHKRLADLMTTLERDHFGIEFGLYLHCELHLTMQKILQIHQAASMTYDASTDHYKSKVLWYDKHRKEGVVKVPRLAPPRSRLEPIIRKIEAQIGVRSNENGLLAYKSLVQVVQEMLVQDPGKQDMPSLDFFHGGANKFPIIIKLDATGFGKLQFNTIAADNPYTSRSAQNLRIFGLGNCSDDRRGSTRLLGANLKSINELINMKKEQSIDDQCMTCEVEGKQYDIAPDIKIVTDTSALRHCEHLAASGWCSCSREKALRLSVPPYIEKPKSLDDLNNFLKECESPTRVQRYVRSHMCLPGESRPRPCDSPGCTFGHNPLTAVAEMEAMLTEEATLAADTTKAGKAKFSTWRMAHAHKHGNVQPGLYGRPMFEHDLDDQILDALHMAELNLPKLPWKHGLLNNSSDDARAAISDQLAVWKHPLDTRRKDDNRVRAQKWFTGEKWATFCAGQRGSPGGPIAIATLVLIVAEDMQRNGNDAAAAPAVGGQGGGGRGGGRGRGRGRGLLARGGGNDGGAPAPDAGVVHIPTALESACNPEDLKVIKDLFGSRARTIINMLLAFDGYFAWYYPFKVSVPYMCPMPMRRARAFENCITAIDMNEIYERVAIRIHGSYLPHGAIYKVSRDILAVALATCGLWTPRPSSSRMRRPSASRGHLDHVT